MIVQRLAPVISSVVAALSGAGIPTGAGEAPDAVGWSGTPRESTFVGYVVVHHLSGGLPDGTIEDPHEFADVDVQLSTYGANAEQTAEMSDLCRAVILPGTWTATGFVLVDVRWTLDGGSTSLDDTRPRIWRGVDRYRIITEHEELA